MNKILMRGILVGCCLCAVLIAGSCSGEREVDGDASGGIQLGLLMETYDVDRWARDQAFFEEKAESLGAQVLTAVADGDQDRQNKQAEIV